MEQDTNHGLDSRIDDMLASDIVTRIDIAKADLEQKMAEMGLDTRDGWKIQEELRDTETGTRWVFRPVHLRKESPELQSSFILDRAGRAK